MATHVFYDLVYCMNCFDCGNVHLIRRPRRAIQNVADIAPDSVAARCHPWSAVCGPDHIQYIRRGGSVELEVSPEKAPEVLRCTLPETCAGTFVAHLLEAEIAGANGKDREVFEAILERVCPAVA